MNEFDKLNLMVVPIQDPVRFHKLPNYNGVPIKWSDSSNYCSWEEREDIYPGVKEWYIIPATRCKYRGPEGIDICYYVIDVDNHEGDKFKEACEFLRSCNLPPSLTIRTPSGGIHKYYRCLSDFIPKAVNGITINGTKLPIEIKSSVGVVAPNGRDRVIIDDVPVAMMMPDSSSLFAKLVDIKPPKDYGPRKPSDPEFPIELEEFPDVISGERHNTLMAKATSLYARGCPPEKIIQWGKEFYLRSNRREQANEISNIVRDAVKYVDCEIERNATYVAELQSAYNQPTNNAPISHVEVPRNDFTLGDDNFTTLDTNTPQKGSHCFTDIFPNFEPLEGYEKLYGQAIFATDDGVKQLLRESLSHLPKEDIPLVRPLLTTNINVMYQNWLTLPVEKQRQYLYLKDTIKLLAN